jgi:hypothetical protein
MSLSAIDAMLRERRLAAMRAEIEQSLDAPPPESQPGRGYDPNQLLRGSDPPDADPWTSIGAAPGTESAAAEAPYAFPMSAPTMNVAAGGWPTGVWPRPGLPLPFPPDAWEPWKRHSEQGIMGLINAWRRVFGGATGGGGDAENECLDRWEREYARCTMFRPYGSRYQKACQERANDRHNLCYRNGGKPDPNEPPEYGWQDIPRDSPR